MQLVRYKTYGMWEIRRLLCKCIIEVMLVNIWELLFTYLLMFEWSDTEMDDDKHKLGH